MNKLNLKMCTACGACVQKCPKNCIELICDFNGFLYPNIDASRCIDCGLCTTVCPIDKVSAIINEQQTAYACANKDKSALLNATSGAIFGAIANFVLKDGGIIYGCSYTQHLQATHVRVDSKEKLSDLFGSKYVQSNICNTYKECEGDLKKGKKVLFSGTPCQIAGLKNYLQKEYVNLITVDIVCHGVASQKYFDKFIEYLENKEGATCIDYNFRSKSNSGWSLAGTAKFKSKNEKFYLKKQYPFSNYYYFYYLKSSIYRECCYSCQYANLNRVGDFTLGDFWGAESLNIPFSIKNGLSLVLLNSKKAVDIFENLNLYKYKVSVETAKKYNKQLFMPSCSLCNRSELLREYREEDASKIQLNFKNKYKKQIILGKLKNLIPVNLKRLLLRIKYKKQDKC